VVAVVVALGVVVLAGGGDGGSGGAGGEEVEYPDGGKVPAVRERNLARAAEAAGCRLEDPRDEGSAHVEGRVRYKANPPVSGNHNQIPTDDGVHEKPPQIERLVHSHEHGRIIIQFRPGLSADGRANLKALFDEDPYHMILTPNGTRMRPQVAATTWGHQLLCPELNDRTYDAIRAFRERWRDRGPEFVQ
jgi:hypothetical protein